MSCYFFYQKKCLFSSEDALQTEVSLRVLLTGFLTISSESESEKEDDESLLLHLLKLVLVLTDYFVFLL